MLGKSEFSQCRKGGFRNDSTFNMALDGPNIMSLGAEPSVERTGKANKRMSAAIAESLSAETLPEKPTSRRHSNQPSKASQEEMQRKMDILMTAEIVARIQALPCRIR